ncbi:MULTISPECIES: sensor histidine kinase NtrY-like [Caulobacter]|jgi:two-component system nitrogen regulation sensor histidine kinase NtrY|uniref:histidine kinase n=1 Tax=Caulobacter rhizosphaerae TaxID=2010972 RepID=A0ABU1N2M1_9CAUL|nr:MULTISPECIES: PAS domain-containing sensor histidine kinase [Caulobacter]KQZ33863.1 PAS domain-containing sensor histidine kinase [Caulobacter sp. Root1472]MDR6532705.1 two-component system nitrogen regulation sensor histidine kinase NtrY [Caulobacter rhizosphaerae]GGL14469.1 PAS domain-containing sensor histidine kinase [Caulobacter rhizosphaerae]
MASVPSVLELEGPPTRFSRAWWRELLRSRFTLGGAYGLAIALTATAVFLASSPPATGPIGPATTVILVVLGFNLALILCIAGIVGWRLLDLVDARASDAGARLHLRFVGLFSVAAVAPAVIVALFFGVLVNRGVDAWFSERVRTVVENSATVARSYVSEQTDYISQHVGPMASTLNQAAPTLADSPVAFGHFLRGLADDNGFSAAYVLDRDGRILARAESDRAPPFLAPPPSSFKWTDTGEIPTQRFVEEDLFRALYRLKAFPDAYLYVARPIDKGILAHLIESEESLISYREAAKNQDRIQVIFGLSYIETALLVLVAAVWVGIAAANSIAAPVSGLVQAAGRVSAGDLDARVDVEAGPEEIRALSVAFNMMTTDLQAQQAALRVASLDAESRRQFIETVLSGVSAGVVGLDAAGRITALNRRAGDLLALDESAVGQPLVEVAPELETVIQEISGGRPNAEVEIDVMRGGETRRLRFRGAGQAAETLVLTFDDITRLMAAQRNAAWKDVARRIAHEIKNPLTPIQLSAERIRRKYRKDITGDLDTFDRCTETIIRQVGDIGRMVDEFSAFARMPAPRFAPADLTEMLRQAVFAQRFVDAETEVTLEEPGDDVWVSCDARMVGQALTNILKNAGEAVSARRHVSPEPPGRIAASLVSDDEHLCLVVEDNGVGLPAKDRDRLTEPYVTTREKGTGLGLAIVKRIMEDHEGELVLTDALNGTGARVILKFPTTARLAAANAQNGVEEMI